VDEVDAPENMTLFVDAFVEAGGTYDGGGVPDDVAPDGAGDDEVIDADDEPVGRADDVAAVVDATEASGSVGAGPTALGGILPIISCP
jgi:hypothetical protein